jgi:hypothetical protein
MNRPLPVGLYLDILKIKLQNTGSSLLFMGFGICGGHDE